MPGLIPKFLVAVPALGLWIGAANAATYDLASEFSSAQGPVWYYGVYTAGGFVEFPDFTPPTSSTGTGAAEA